MTLEVCQKCGKKLTGFSYASDYRKYKLCDECLPLRHQCSNAGCSLPKAHLKEICRKCYKKENPKKKPKRKTRKPNQIKQTRCKATTKKGKQCKNYTYGEEYCRAHRKKTKSAPKRKNNAGKETYSEYLSSPEWQARRTMVISYWDGKCALCNAPANVVHHNNYKNKGKENHNDLVLLCRFHHDWFEKYHKYDRRTNTIKWRE